MRLEPAGEARDRAGPLHRLDARLKLVFTLAFVVAVIASPVG